MLVFSALFYYIVYKVFMKNQEDIVRKIKALQERTMQNGCSEEEAIQAAKMIDKLLLKYNLSLTDVEIKETDCGIKEVKTGTKRMPTWVCTLADACAKHYDTKLLFTGGSLQFFGMPEDVAAAISLNTMLKSAVDMSLAEYTCSKIYRISRCFETARCLNKSFRLGMVEQLKNRLTIMKKELEAEIKSCDGTALVALKADKVEQDIAIAFPNLKTSVRRNSNISGNAFNHGKDAANMFSFQTKVSRQNT